MAPSLSTTVKITALLVTLMLGVTVVIADRHEQDANAAAPSEFKTLIASSGDGAGLSVAVSGDTAVVGAYRDTVGLTYAGAAYVFQRNQGGTENWGQVKKLIASDALAFDFFGRYVAVSGDTAVVSGGSAAYVFQRNQGGADNWGEVKKLAASDAQSGSGLGGDVAVEGDIAIIAAWGDAAYLFHRNQGGADNWGEVKKLSPANPLAANSFGSSLAISGNTVVVGASNTFVGACCVGVVIVFERNEGGADNWGELKELTSSDMQAAESFGRSVGVSGDTLIVGSDGTFGAGIDTGKAFVFQRDEGGADNWGEVKRITASDAQPGDGFMNVAISGDTVIVGAEGEDAGGDGAGAAYVFQRNHGGTDNWGEVEKLIASDSQPGAFFGKSVAVSSYTSVVGADGWSGGGPDESAAYLFLEPTPTPTSTLTPTPTNTPTPTPCPPGKVPANVGCGTPTLTPTPKGPDGDTDGDTIPNSTDPDDDNDGCTDVQELGPDETLGGRRNPHNPWDFYDVETISGPGQDGVVDLLFDILGVINHYHPAAGGAPPYDAHYDRGPSAGPNAWNMTAPDGVIDLLNDILGVIRQFDHRCT